MIINSLVLPVINKLRNRTELASSIPYYIALALIELSQNIEFEELKQTGPLANFVPLISEYPLLGYDVNGINGNPFVQSVEDKITFVNSWFVYYDTSGIPVVGTSMGMNINKRDLHTVETLSKVKGIPSVYTIHGDKINKGVIIVGCMPDNPYACRMRYQKEHSFKIPHSQISGALTDRNINSALASSIIYLPDDWSDIIVYVAAEKICDDTGMTDIGQLYHNKLYGYKDKRGNEMPGLIVARQTSEERNTLFNSRQMRPVVKRYT